VTVLVTLASAYAPTRWVATIVASTFLAATWLLVFRRDDEAVSRAGLAFAGLVLPEPLDGKRISRAVALSVSWALAFAVLTFGPFYVGFRLYARYVWHVHGVGSAPPFHGLSTVNEVLGQLALIALPEEAFYRGYLQSRLDDAWPARVRVFGAGIGVSIVVTSAIFAVGHLLTIHDPGRLAVFFPSLLFGWLRARTGGVGASIVYHASCNLFSATLVSTFGPHVP
jgi:membrane protease YdiL (CAAX protease family)